MSDNVGAETLGSQRGDVWGGGIAGLWIWGTGTMRCPLGVVEEQVGDVSRSGGGSPEGSATECERKPRGEMKSWATPPGQDGGGGAGKQEQPERLAEHHAFRRHVLSTYYVPGPGNTEVNKTDMVPALWQLTDQKQCS